MDPSPAGQKYSSSQPEHAQFLGLVLPHLDSLLDFARRRASSDADAEDLVQDACVRAWAAFGGLRDERKVRAWLYRILHTLICDQHRTNARRAALASLTPLTAQHAAVIATPELGPAERLGATRSAARVRRALDEIPEEFASAVALHDIAGFRYREIAEILDVPIGTVMSRIARGRKLLAEIITADPARWDVALPVPSGDGKSGTGEDEPWTP